MIVGHVGVALAARWRWPAIPLPWLLAATMAPDIWRVLLALSGMNWRENNIYSHLLPWSGILALGCAGAAYLVFRRAETALVVGGLVITHIALDWVSGWKVLWIGGPAGLDLEHFEQLEFVVETIIVWWGWRLMRRSSAPRWTVGWQVLLLLLVIQASYLIESFRARPWKTRCISYPLSPCWTHL
ncbi:MAG: hypothetical protein ABJE47_24685 [bacterium]